MAEPKVTGVAGGGAGMEVNEVSVEGDEPGDEEGCSIELRDWVSSKMTCLER